MEEPECPVCLQSYDGESTVPRVLACGHTACEECLTNLPKKFPDTIRCPACTVLVKFPPQGPSALPKNIDLLRLFPSISKLKLEPGRNFEKVVEFVTRSWSDDFYATWKDRILVHDAVSVEIRESESSDFDSSSRLCGSLRDDSKVSLLRVASFEHGDCDSVLKYSYVQRMMSCLWGMREEERDELDAIISVKQRGVSKVFGLWGDLKNGVLYLVGEKLIGFSLEEFDSLEDETLRLGIIGMQICEALLNLHKEGLITGCLSVSCVKFDEYENAYVDLIELIETGRNVYRIIAEETSSLRKPVGASEMGLIFVGLQQKGIFISSEAVKRVLRISWCYTQARPVLTDLWKCIRELVMKPRFNSMSRLHKTIYGKRKQFCLAQSELCRLVEVESKEVDKELPGMKIGDEAEEGKVDIDFPGRVSEGKVRSKDMRGHQDSVTGLAVGGGFLFSSSYDRTILIWSLKDFSHVHTFKGHQDKVMALIHIEGTEPVCVSGDGGGGIFVWSTTFPLEEQPLRKWYEPKDWRYTGIHALAYSEYGHVYTGSGDNTIKAWSLQDGSLLCTMSGHKSVVSTLVVVNGVLYSGSWDGTVRLWSLSDNSLLTVLGEETPGIVRSILSLAADDQTLVAAYQNGDIQIWRDDTLMKSMKIQNGAILSIAVNGKWLFTGGWDKTINVQELSGDEISVNCAHVGSIPGSSVITSLLYWEGKLFAGFADKTIKVYYFGR
ncbi:unnamed protein product [Arabidopsis thaliana]|uniref:(thale cress) hypothetical protein n=1 Tax=Arabidopsis thaliana TaxID=3702 RepID=A0A7G2DYI3_ARATH|nr:unnamed protein product [Arabidopsis thaliana]